MRKLAGAVVAAAVVLGTVAVFAPVPAEPPPVRRQAVFVQPMVGARLFTPTASNPGYRKAPSMMVNADGSIDLWTCARDGAGPGNKIVHRRSADGRVWPNTDVTVLTPTPGARDSADVCHPSVVKLGGYYYMAYSATSTSGPLRKYDLFVARSGSPSGPFEKWNGFFWGSNTPQPIISHFDDGYGAWAPSLVVKDGLLYLFYAATAPTQGQQTNAGTRAAVWLATADVSGRDGPTDQWPERLDPQGSAIELPGQVTADGTGSGIAPDVKYLPDPDRFIALAAGDPLTDDAFPVAFESPTGLEFTRTIMMQGDWQPGAFDVGLSSDELGAVDVNVPEKYIAYSTSGGFAPGHYPTYLNPLLIGTSTAVGALTPDEGNAATSWKPLAGSWSTVNGAYTSTDPSVVAATKLQRVVSDSTTIEVDVKFGRIANPDNSLAVVGFGGPWIPLPGKGVGYSVALYPSGQVALSKDVNGTNVQLATAKAPVDPRANYEHLRIVKSHATISVFVGLTRTPTISVTDESAPYTGGTLELRARGAVVSFRDVSVADNVPSTGYGLRDWRSSSGDWGIGDYFVTQGSATGGQMNLQDTSSGYSTTPDWAGADGTYTTRVRLEPGQPLDRWAGMNLANPDLSGYARWEKAPGGYLVFLRGNGNVGLFKAGEGQVVPDVATGANPVSRWVELRVVKTGRNLQVYVGGAPVPYINYTDTTASASSIGAFALVTLGVSSFSYVGYAADGAH